MPNLSLSLLVLKSRDLEPVRSFYNALGIELVEEKHGSGPMHFAGRAGEVILELYPLADDASAVDSTTRLGFTVSNLENVIRELQAIGAPLITPSRETPWGRRAVVRDPDGRAVELYQREVIP